MLLIINGFFLHAIRKYFEFDILVCDGITRKWFLSRSPCYLRIVVNKGKPHSKNPSIVIKGEKIVFPVEMESGMYLEFLSLSDCKLYGSKGELLKEVTPIGKHLNLVKGENEILFSCDGPESVNARVQVTVISEGKPLGKGKRK